MTNVNIRYMAKYFSGLLGFFAGYICSFNLFYNNINDIFYISDNGYDVFVLILSFFINISIALLVYKACSKIIYIAMNGLHSSLNWKIFLFLSLSWIVLVICFLFMDDFFRYNINERRIFILLKWIFLPILSFFLISVFYKLFFGRNLFEGFLSKSNHK